MTPPPSALTAALAKADRSRSSRATEPTVELLTGEIVDVERLADIPL